MKLQVGNSICNTKRWCVFPLTIVTRMSLFKFSTVSLDRTYSWTTQPKKLAFHQLAEFRIYNNIVSSLWWGFLMEYRTQNLHNAVLITCPNVWLGCSHLYLLLLLDTLVVIQDNNNEIVIQCRNQKLSHGKKSKYRVLTCKVLIGPHGLLKK